MNFDYARLAWAVYGIRKLERYESSNETSPRLLLLLEQDILWQLRRLPPAGGVFQ